jgi:hypothetical protein
MTETISDPQVCQILQSAIGQIRANHEMLSRLDAAVADGDHGEAGTGPSKILTADEAAELMCSRLVGAVKASACCSSSMAAAQPR